MKRSNRDSNRHFICQYGLESRRSPAPNEFLIEAMSSVLERIPYANSYVMYGTLLWYADKKELAESYFQKALSKSINKEQSEFYMEKIETIKRS